MKELWATACVTAANGAADFWSGNRKITRNKSLTFHNRHWTNDLSLADLGYTKAKMSQLNRNYYHPESVETALMLWDRRRKQNKFGSVGITCYNHFIKSNPDKKSKLASTMGPCIQAVTLTLVPREPTKVDVFYRTTELFKKFPADLIWLRDHLLAPFELEDLDVQCHFANMSVHPMYWAVVVPHQKHPIAALEVMKLMDLKMYNWTMKWLGYLLCPEHIRGIARFSQAVRVQTGLVDALDTKTNRKLTDYVRKNHPGFRNEYRPTPRSKK